MRKELDGHRASAVSTLQETEKAREELQTAKKEALEQVRGLEQEVANAQQTSKQAAEHMEQLKQDIVKFQTAARNSYTNYERELQLHAKAEADLKELDAELNRTKAALLAAQQTAADLTAASIRAERGAAEKKTRMEETLSQQREQMESLKRINDKLHSQMASLSVQVRNHNSQ